MREEDLPFRCGRCGAFVGQERGHEADDFLPVRSEAGGRRL